MVVLLAVHINYSVFSKATSGDGMSEISVELASVLNEFDGDHILVDSIDAIATLFVISMIKELDEQESGYPIPSDFYDFDDDDAVDVPLSFPWHYAVAT